MSDELIDIIDSAAAPKELYDWWDNESKWFLVLLPHEKVEEIEAMIERLDGTQENSDDLYDSLRLELKYKVETLKESMALNLENIF